MISLYNKIRSYFKYLSDKRKIKKGHVIFKSDKATALYMGDGTYSISVLNDFIDENIEELNNKYGFDFELESYTVGFNDDDFMNDLITIKTAYKARL